MWSKKLVMNSKKHLITQEIPLVLRVLCQGLGTKTNIFLYVPRHYYSVSLLHFPHPCRRSEPHSPTAGSVNRSWQLSASGTCPQLRTVTASKSHALPRGSWHLMICFGGAGKAEWLWRTFPAPGLNSDCIIVQLSSLPTPISSLPQAAVDLKGIPQ